MPPSSPDGSAASPDADHARLQHQPDRLAHRHEVALHVGMRDRQRAAARELALEQRHHGAGAAQHVAEAHGDAAHAAAARPRAAMSSAWQYISASRFDAPITRGRVHRLVGGDQHHRQRAHAARRVGHVAGAGDIGQQPLQRVGLHHRHVLQRRGVEHQFRPPCLEHRAHARLVADVGQQRLARQRAGGVSASSRSICHSAYSPLSSRISRSGPERGDLAGQFAADGAAGAGDDDAPALDQPRHALAVERHLRRGSAGPRSPSAAVPADARGPPTPAGSERGGARRAADPHAVPFRLLHQDRQRLAGQVRRGDHQRVRQPALAAQALQHRGGILDRAEERVALDAPPGLARSRPPAAPPPAAPAADPRPARAGTGRRPRPPRPAAPTGRRRRSWQRAAAAAVAPAAIDHAGRRRAAPAASAHTPRGRRDWRMPRRSAQARSRTGRRQARWTRPPQAGHRCRQNARIATAA